MFIQVDDEFENFRKYLHENKNIYKQEITVLLKLIRPRQQEFNDMIQTQ